MVIRDDETSTTIVDDTGKNTTLDGISVGEHVEASSKRNERMLILAFAAEPMLNSDPMRVSVCVGELRSSDAENDVTVAVSR